MGQSKKSIYNPSYPKKYKGNPNKIIGRRNWERLFCKWCDSNEKILEWGSEEFWIPYRSPIDHKIHRYFPDFLIKLREPNGKVRTYVIEVKPKKQTVPPKQKSKITESYVFEARTYAVNQAKWKAAKEFCADRRIEFKIVTEDDLGV